jgi:hypothetical protein
LHRLLLVAATTAEPAEQSASAAVAAHLLLHRPAAGAAVAGERVHELGLAPAIAAATGNCVALRLELLNLTPRILDLVVHLEAFRAAHQSTSEDEEAPLKATRILHRRLGALVDAARVLNLLVDAGQRLSPAAALGARELLLQLHAADLMIAVLGLRVTCHESDGRAAQGKNGKAAMTATVARYERGRKLLTGVHVLAFPTDGDPRKAVPARALGRPHYARPSLGVNAA